jgi:small GTP-binding protein
MSDRRLFKVLFSGDPSTGKTSVISKIVNIDADISELRPTVGPDCATYQMERDNIQVQLQDCPGALRYQSIIPVVYRNVSLIIVLFAFNSKQSFEAVAGWKARAAELSPGTPVILVGNKADLVRDARPDWASDEEALRGDAVSYFEVSALTGSDIDLLQDAIEERARGPAAVAVIPNDKGLDLGNETKPEERSCC